MKNLLLIAGLIAASLLSDRPLIAADKEEAKPESKAQAKADLQVLVMKIQNKVAEGKKTEQDLADDIKEFDVLLAKYKDDKSEDVARILLMKSTLYIELFGNMEKGAALIQQLKKDFPETSLALKADEILAQIKQQQEVKKVQSGMAVGAPFPDFEEKDLANKPLSVAQFKGKVVLVDFWATWCGPCVRELPNVLQTYEKYHPKGFEIIGISLDQDKTRLTSFIEQQKMTWPQYFDGKGWGNKLAAKYGVNSIPATYLLDGEGKIIARNLRGEDLAAEVAKALEKH